MIRSFLSAFGGTAVEYFETVVIAYAIIRVGYRREAISATIVGHLLVFVAAVFLWPLQELIPVFWFRLVAASLLTVTGLYWAAKSWRRLWRHERPRWVDDPLGKVGLAAAAPTAPAGAGAPRPAPGATPVPGSAAAAFSAFAFLVMFKSSLVEAMEILLVLFPIGAATGRWSVILLGAGAAIVVVTVLACILHGYLKRIPEVKLKLAIGLLLAAIGVSWLLEL